MRNLWLVLSVAVGTALVVFWMVAPRLLSRQSPRIETAPETEPAGVSSPAATPVIPPASETDITPPLTPEERARVQREARRAPFYTWLRQSPWIAGFRPVEREPATLDIYLNRDDFRLVPMLMHEAIAPVAGRYGFQKVRFYVPNPPGNVDRYRLEAEATQDSDGQWRTFRK
ncbi:MAG: hypothetical protein NZ557_04600 [Chthonomonadaceae bacterium]|nr:hypothetical protein [Chthonomonadaceae bacterium]